MWVDFHLAHNINHSWTHKHAAGKGTPGFNTCSSTCTFCEARTNLYWRRAGNGPSSLGLLSAINIEETIWVHHYDGVRLSFLLIPYLILIINHDHLCHLNDCIWDCSLADWEILFLWIFGLSLCFAFHWPILLHPLLWDLPKCSRVICSADVGQFYNFIVLLYYVFP